MERNMNREVETIREKVHTTADAALIFMLSGSEGKPFQRSDPAAAASL